MDPSHPTKAWVAEIDGAVVGFGHMRTHWDTFTGGPAWFLDDLYTSSAARGHGAGTQIINALRAHADAHGGGTISWITADNNATAQSVYDKLAARQTWVTYEMGG
jgi:GNAT superfamily N-acetyltransferase